MIIDAYVSDKRKSLFAVVCEDEENQCFVWRLEDEKGFKKKIYEGDGIEFQRHLSPTITDIKEFGGKLVKIRDSKLLDKVEKSLLEFLINEKEDTEEFEAYRKKVENNNYGI